MTNVDNVSLLVTLGTRELHAPPMQHYLDAFDGAETRAALKARDGALDAVRAFSRRIDEIRRSRMLTDHERAALRLKAADDALAKLKPAESLISMNEAAADKRERSLKPAADAATSDSQVMLDLMLVERAERFDAERKLRFFEGLRSENPLPSEIRLAEAIVRAGPLSTLPAAEWVQAHDLLHEHRNRQALVELRAIRAATEQTGRFLAEARRMIESEVALERSRSEPAAGGFVEVPTAA